MSVLDLLSLAGSGLAFGLALASGVEARRAIARCESLQARLAEARRELVQTRLSLSAVEIHLARIGKQAREDRAVFDAMRAMAESSDVLSFLATTGQVDDPGPDGFVRIHEPKEGGA